MRHPLLVGLMLSALLLGPLAGAPNGGAASGTLGGVEDAFALAVDAFVGTLAQTAQTYHTQGEATPDLQKGRLTFVHAQSDADGDGIAETVMDRDGDGRADGWQVGYDPGAHCVERRLDPPEPLGFRGIQRFLTSVQDGSNPRTVPCRDAGSPYPEAMLWVQRDLLFTGPGTLRPSVMVLDPTDGTLRYADPSLAVAGGRVTLSFGLAADDGGPGPLFAVIADADDPQRRLVVQVHKEDLQGHDRPPDGILFTTPVLVDEIVLLPTDDPDQDGYHTFAEVGEWPPANPFNRASVPGDADADGCSWQDGGETRDEDRDPDVRPCQGA